MSHANNPEILQRLRRAEGHLATVIRMVEDGRDGLQIHVDHLWHPVTLASTEDFELPLYVGIGGRVFDFDDDNDRDGLALGLRAPIGLSLDLNRTPIDIFFELALVADLFVDYDDKYGVDVNGALGLRYYFD